MEVGKEQCQLQAAVISKNESICSVKACQSPWRFCISCLRQGYKGKDNLVVNPNKGLCDFHLVRGPNAVRPTGNGLTVVDNVDRPENKNGDGNGHPVTQSNNEQIKDDVMYVGTGQIVHVDPKRILPNPNQPRKYFDPKDMADLERSIKLRGQVRAALLMVIKDDPRHDFMLVDGERRWVCCGKLGKDLRGEIVEVVDDQDLYENSVISNFHNPGHTPLEKMEIIETEHTKFGRTLSEIAELTGLSLNTIVRLRKLKNLCPEALAQLDPQIPEDKRLPLTIFYNLGELSHDAQRVELKKILDFGVSATQARESIRQAGRREGIKVGGQRSPKNYFSMFQTFLRRSHGDAQLFTSMDDAQFESLFLARDASELTLALRRTNESKKEIEAILSRLEKLKKH